ncbi:glycosyltransferase family 4 protein [Flavobacterium sp. LHD-80]|uniref:glycosyltransferase family 4 protein n=1 Tax=Flavobacterium sp. LHD-80 TaxID=3071411 RepID=UPI0027E1EB83|nr:glycosyltransferase family 4 protein [Flavobacterium sp. LHD-80]MDQ6472057.1 glycosyltransferase family 4 protein [Flavobacterium sp. LHD-80]
MKKVWLINPAAMPPKYEARIQTLKRAQYLRLKGYDVTIISGSYLHNTDINLIDDKASYKFAEYEDGQKFIHIRTFNYNSNGLIRIYSILQFYFRLWWYASRFEKPDFISHLAAVPFGNITYFVAKKIKAKFIVDIVDLWPESFVAYGLVSKKNPLVKLAYWAEYWLYKKADLLIFSMEGGKDYIKEKKWDIDQGGKIDINNVHYINNGVDLKDFDYNKINYKISDDDLENDHIFKVIYIGSIRLANNVMQLVEAAQHLKDVSDIKFLIYGDGEDRSTLEQYCKDNKIENVVFKQKWVELKYVPYILSKSSLNILNYKPSSILRYGGSQSKSFQYMASGKPICANVEMNYCPIKKFNIGIAKEFKNSKEYADAILSFYKMDRNEYNAICINARNASENYDYKLLTERYVELISQI